MSALAAVVAGATLAAAQTIERATLGEPKSSTAEVSTAELRQILAERSATVFDARPAREFALSHIPGALNVAAKPGVPIAVYVSDAAEIGRAVKGDKAAPIVLYCNGPFCGKSKRLADELLAAGHTNVRRYQLGIPVWRALGGICQIEPEGLRHVLADDPTAALIDAREAAAFAQGSLPRARNIPRSLVLDGKDVGEVRRAKDDGRLPMEDHNTRIVVVAADADAAAFVATALAREAFHNVSYFAGTFEQARAAAGSASDAELHAPCTTRSCARISRATSRWCWRTSPKTTSWPAAARSRTPGSRSGGSGWARTSARRSSRCTATWSSRSCRSPPTARWAG